MRQGPRKFDLGIGEARYKATYCDAAVPLFDIVLPLNAKGRILAVKQRSSPAPDRRSRNVRAPFAALRRVETFHRT